LILIVKLFFNFHDVHVGVHRLKFSTYYRPKAIRKR